MDAADLAPVVCQHPFSGDVVTVPFGMVQAYVPYNGHLKLEEAAKVAAIRDTDEANNFILSVDEFLLSNVF